MANNYIAKIRAELDSGSLQEQINKIVKNSGTIKIKVEADGDISGFIKDISKKVESAGNVSIKPKVDVSEIDSSFGTLSKKISTIVDGSVKSVQEIYKSVGDGFDTTVSQVDGETKKVTQDYESYAKRISTLEKQINAELEKASSNISEIKKETTERTKLEERLAELSSSGVSEETLEKTKSVVQASNNILSLQNRINSELEKSYSYISKMQEGTESRLFLEKKLEEISGLGIDESVLEKSKQLTAEAERFLSSENKTLATSEKITSELERAEKFLSQMSSDYSGFSNLKYKFDTIQYSPDTKENLEAAKKLTQEIQEHLQYSQKLLELEKRQREETEKIEKAQASAINKEQERLYKGINSELEKSSSIISEIMEGTEERYSLEKKLEEVSSGGITQENLDKAKKLTAEAQEQLSVQGKIASIDGSINAELQKTSSYISKMKEGTSERVALERKLSDIAGSEVDERTLTRAKQLTAEAKEKLDIEKKELSIQEQIDNQIKEIKTRIEAVKMSSSQRLEIEKKIEDAMAMENSKDRLNGLKNINTEIVAMGKNAMSLGAMLKTAYEKFANKLRLCTEMCIENNAYMQVNPKALYQNRIANSYKWNGAKAEKT